MHKDLVLVFHRFIELLKEDERCKGGWHFGSISRGENDIYSDYDLVFLVAGKDFETFTVDANKILAEVCDEVLLYWGESFNDSYFKNYCSLLRVETNLHQFDLFFINVDYPDNWMSKLHSKGCTREHIIFDKTGEVAEFLDKDNQIEKEVYNSIRIMDTYWFHAEMLIKYFKRKDFFKLIKVINLLYQTHVELLLSQYNTLDWGSIESKVGHCVPDEKKEHLKTYFANPDFHELEVAVKTGMNLFKEDAEELCKLKGIVYPENIASQVIAYFNQRMCSDLF
jgi:predicted nucleotidyltransferase